MKLKVFSNIDQFDGESAIDDWLSEVGPIRISHTEILIKGPSPKMFVFYEDAEAPTKKQAKKQELCRQCRKNPPAPGKKQCEPCRQYQAEYRKQRKEEKKIRYP